MTNTKFAINFLGARFRVKLVDCASLANIDVSDVVDQFIVFYRPQGAPLRRVEKQATLIEDPVSSGNFFINYLNTTPEASVLDFVGSWEYAARVVLSNGDSFESVERFVFKVS